MTINQVIQAVDGMKPHSFSKDVLTMWVNEIEGMVQTDIFLISHQDIVTYTYEANKDSELLVKAPHSKIYIYYVAAMIDFANNDYDKYTNTMDLFNKFYSDYMRWYALTVDPANGRAISVGYYLSAYGIAVQHGFEGTEEQWLLSLHGEKGAQGDGWVVKGYVESEDQLPLASSGDITDGTVYGVGTAEPYLYYVWNTDKGWVNNGTFSPTLSESWARGNTGVRTGEDTDNSLYYASQSKSYAEDAETAKKEAAGFAASAALAKGSAENSEQQAKDHAEIAEVLKEEAANFAVSAALSKDSAKSSEQQAKSYAEDAETAKKEAAGFASSINPILFCNALKGKATGTHTTRIDDVSPIPRDINVQFSHKNLIDQDAFFNAVEEYNVEIDDDFEYIFSCVIKESADLKNLTDANIVFAALNIMDTREEYFYDIIKDGRIINENTVIELNHKGVWQYSVIAENTTFSAIFDTVALRKLANNLEVDVFNKNISKFDPINKNWSSETSVGKNYDLGNITFPAVVSVKFNGNNITKGTVLLRKKQYDPETKKDYVDVFYFIKNGGPQNNAQFQINEEGYGYGEYFIFVTKATLPYVENIQLETGTVATDIVTSEYIGKVYPTYNDDGTASVVINYSSPTMTLICNDSGVNTDIEYNRDINYAIEMLEQAMIANL